MTKGKFPNGLRAAMLAEGIGQSELARRIKATRQDVSRWANQERRLTPEDAATIAPHLKTTAEELLLLKRQELVYDPRDPADPDPIDPDRAATVGEYTPANLPDGASPQLDVTGGMGAGGFILTADGVPGVSGMTFAAEHISGFWQMPAQVQSALAIRAKDTVIIPVQGNSMAPTLIEGDFVFVDTRHRWPSPDGVYALADDFGGIIVKTLRLADSDHGDGPHIEIVSDNPDKDRYPPKLRRAEDLRIIGRVVRRFSAVF